MEPAKEERGEIGEARVSVLGGVGDFEFSRHDTRSQEFEESDTEIRCHPKELLEISVSRHGGRFDVPVHNVDDETSGEEIRDKEEHESADITSNWHDGPVEQESQKRDDSEQDDTDGQDVRNTTAEIHNSFVEAHFATAEERIAFK